MSAPQPERTLSPSNNRAHETSIGAEQRRVESDGSARIEALCGAYREILKAVGEDITREGIEKTPLRCAKSLLYLTKGYQEDLKELVGNAVFDEDHDEMVLVKDIPFYSLCEHHMIPFFGKIHIAYIPDKKVVGISKLARISEMYARRLQMHIAYVPDKKVVGISKLARISEMYARRLQVQERMTKQIAQAIDDVLSPAGAFRDDAKTREEFLALIRH